MRKRSRWRRIADKPRQSCLYLPQGGGGGGGGDFSPGERGKSTVEPTSPASQAPCERLPGTFASAASSPGNKTFPAVLFILRTRSLCGPGWRISDLIVTFKFR